MALTFDTLEFIAGEPIVLDGITDNIDAKFVSPIDGENFPVNADGSFTINLTPLIAGTYSLNLKTLDTDLVELDAETLNINVINPAPITTPEVTPPTEDTTMSIITPEAEALIAQNSSTIQTFIPKYEIGTETDTDNISVYPGSKLGFGPLSKSENSASKADEFKIMSDAALVQNPSAGYTGGRGTGNPDNFGKFPYRNLMTDLRGEFFPKNGDFDANSETQYPLGRTADILENAVYPEGFTQKDANGYSTTTTRGGADASPIPTTGFTF